MRGAVSPDHVPMLVVLPPQLAPAKLVQFLKDAGTRQLQQLNPLAYLTAAIIAHRRRQAAPSLLRGSHTP